VFDVLDEHDDGQVGRDEFLASLDLDHPHLMSLLKATALTPPGEEGEGGVATTSDHHDRHDRRSSSAAAARDGRGDGAVGPEALSVFDAIEANDEDFISWDEVRACRRVLVLGDAFARAGGRASRARGCTAGAGKPDLRASCLVFRSFTNPLDVRSDSSLNDILQSSSNSAQQQFFSLCRGEKSASK